MKIGAFINSIPGSFLIINEQLKTVYQSPQASDFFKMPSEEIILGSSIQFHNLDVIPHILKMSDDAVYNFDDVLYADSGFEARVNVRVKKIIDNGKLYYLWLFLDYSEELESRQEMIDFMAEINSARAQIHDYAKDIEVFKNVINNISQGILLTDEEENLVFSNDFANDLFAFNKSNITLNDIISCFTHSSEMTIDEMKLAIKAGFLKNEVLVLDFENRNERRCYLTVFEMKQEGAVIDNYLVWNFVEINRELENTQALIDFTTELNELNEELKRKNKQILYYSRIDSLTGIYNRGYLFEIFNTKLNEAKTDCSDLCVVLFDVDKFKNINDSYGHVFGDLVLKKLAVRVKSLLPEGCLLGRYGGEEYMIILPKFILEQAKTFAEEVRLSVEGLRFKIHGETVSITISAGVSKFVKDDTFDSIINRADAALYFAKRSGRNQVVSE